MTTDNIEDGGPAYPVQYSNERDGPTVMPSAGMSLRDYFAAKAMQEVMSEPDNKQMLAPDVATIAYAFADAMLKARKQ